MHAKDSALRLYAVALATLVMAILARKLLDPFLGDRFPYPTFLLAITFVAWYCGVAPSVATTLVGLLSATYFFVPPRGTLTFTKLPDEIGAGTFIFIGLTNALFVGLMRSAQARAEKHAGEAQAKQLELERAEQKAQRDRERLHITLTSIGDAVVVTDPQCNVTLMNSVAQELTGWRADAVGKPVTEVFDIVHQKTRQPLPSPVQKVIDGGKVVGLAQHTVLIAKDGTERPIEDSAAPIRDDKGNLVGVVLVFRDVSDRNRSEQALRESENRLRLFIKHAPAAIAVFDNDMRYLALTNRWRLDHGLDGGDILGRNHYDVFPRIPQRWRDIHERGLKGETLHADEDSLQRADGSTQWLRWEVRPWYTSGDDIGGIIILAEDITDRKKAVDVVRTHAERLSLLWEAGAVLLSTDEPATMMHALFDRIAPHLQLDSYFNFVVNETNDALRLESCAGILDETARSIKRLEFGQAICGTVALHRKAIVASYIQQSDDPMVQLAKSLGIRAYTCNPLISNGRLFGTLSFASRRKDEFDVDELEFLRTITHYVTVACERMRLVKELRDTDRRKDEFLAMLAHELRNPLAPIRNAVQILNLFGANDPSLRQAREMIERQVAHMVRLVDDLLDVSRITRGKITLKRESVDLTAIVMNAVESSRAFIETRHHDLKIDRPAEPMQVEGDPTRLTQIVLNLINNSAKYTPEGGHIAVTLTKDDDQAVLRIRDDGVGIGPDLLPKVFELFIQAERTLDRSQGGLGIGLTLVKRLTELHGGTVEARSAGLGQGSEFTVRLPVVTDAAPARGPQLPSAPRENAAKRRLLVVDDNKDSADSLAMLLKALGNEVKTANDGWKAIESASEYRPDAIFLDIGLPGMDGYTVARKVREIRALDDTILVALTGYGSAGDRRRSMEAGFYSHMIKPVEFSSLENLLASLPNAPHTK